MCSPASRAISSGHTRRFSERSTRWATKPCSTARSTSPWGSPSSPAPVRPAEPPDAATSRAGPSGARPSVPSRQAPGLDGRGRRPAHPQVDERPVVVQQEPLGGRRAVGEDPVVGEGGEDGLRDAPRVAVLGQDERRLQRVGALLRPSGVMGHQHGVLQAEQLVAGLRAFRPHAGQGRVVAPLAQERPQLVVVGRDAVGAGGVGAEDAGAPRRQQDQRHQDRRSRQAPGRSTTGRPGSRGTRAVHGHGNRLSSSRARG